MVAGSLKKGYGKVRCGEWNRTEFKRPKNEIKQLEERYKQLEAGQIMDEVHQEMFCIRTQLMDFESREMLRWQQRSKQHWLANGDGNTTFFHSRASTRKRLNTISKLKDSNGVWQEKEEDIQGILLQHFRSVFASNRSSNSSIDEVMDVIPCRVTPEMNSQLLHPFTEAEVKHAIFCMFPFKSPGPDGMSPVFFQKFWSIVGPDVTNSVLRILNDHSLLYKMNYTHVVLIPKCNNPELVSQLRSISFRNVGVKIASKCIANRLTGILNDIVPPTQSAFIPDRLITDNVLLAFELNHFLKVYSRSKKGYVALKLNMSKAYDRIEWSFLRHEAERRGVLQGVRVSPTAPSVSHLLFADDTLLFCEATRSQVEEIRRILALYTAASGQEVNFSKSSMVVSGNITHSERRNLASILGLPAMAGRSRKALFQNIRDHFWDRISGWNSKLLSQAGKGMLIKSVLQSLPTYAMSCFKLPDHLLLDMEKAMRDFWWHSRGEKCVHWVAWRKLCRPMLKGGKAFNIVMLAKQGWRILSQQTSLLSRVLKARYFPLCSFWEAQVGSRPSLTWRSILLARGVLRVGCDANGAYNQSGEPGIVWRPSKKGVFSVKSAYEVVTYLEAGLQASSSRPYHRLAEGVISFGNVSRL
ncbi:UNVERIFIED_CONTAM: putative mitochondrial protein [Sesamum radiatum]|uniref:Mitochondrial protein n=1 Tax=Sesamum radiatum TaxID=300843 RepID=A0AAW2PI77_SESRA